MASAQGNIQNRTYYYRLQTLLIEGGALVIRKVFDEKKTHSPLSVCLQYYKQRLRRSLNKQQRDVLYPSSGVPTSDDFDMSLLMILLRHACGLRSFNDAVRSATPSTADVSVEADIGRLRLARNELAHSPSTTAISQNDFQSKWSEIEQSLSRLNKGIQNGVHNLSDQLSSFKNAPLDLQAEARFKQEMKTWEETDEAMTKDIGIVKQKLDNHGDLLKNISTTTQKVDRRSDRIEYQIGDITGKVDGLVISSALSKADQDVISKNIHDIRETQLQLKSHSSQRQEMVQQDLENINSGMSDIKIGIKSVQNKMDIPRLSPKQKSLHDTSQMFFEDAEEKSKIYFKTGVYKEAREKLQRSGLAILSGHPGEGKTTMATYLLLETSPIKKLLRLSRPTDWRLVDLDEYNAILIDDIFGSGILDEQRLCQWEGFLSEINLATERKQLSVIITTRHYILKDARESIHRLEMFKDDNITTLSSSKLTLQEKHRILEKHLERNGRVITASLFFDDHFWKGSACDSESELLLGYPECAAMFASTEKLYSKGFEFFSSPVEFFRKCLTELSQNEDEFKALVLVWARPSNKLKIEDLERKNIARLLDIEDEFDYPIGKHTKSIKKYLEHHKNEFLIFNTKTGEYSFSHHVISDVVGLVAAKDNPKAVVRYGSKDFIMRCVTTQDDECHNEIKVYIEKYLYPDLIDKLCQLLYDNEDNEPYLPNYYDVRLKEEGIEKTKICRSTTTDRSIVKHDAFRNTNFINKFVFTMNGDENKLVSRPFVEVFELFKPKYCIEFVSGEVLMCLPSLLLAKKNKLLVEECLGQSVLTESEKCISLLLATRERDKDLVQKLIDNGATANDDVIQIASINQDFDILELLLQSGSNCKSHIQNGNSPLITAAKRGCLGVVQCLLDGGVDVNYRNQNKVSALDKAVYRNNKDMCRELLIHGAKLNEKGGKFDRTPLHSAVDMGLTDIVNMMLEFGADVCIQDHRGEYPVHSAAIQGHTEILRSLLEKDNLQANFKLNSHGKENFKGMTLYHFAVLTENKDLIGILKEFKTDPNLQDRYGRTPLYFAAFHGKMPFVQLLLDVADPEKPEKNGYTPLHAAVHKCHLDIVRYLCNRVNVNLQDKRGHTPFHLACKKAQFDIIKVLLDESGADVRIQTKKGENVFHLLTTNSGKTNIGRARNTSKTIVKCAKAIFRKDPSFRTILEKLERREEIAPILQTISDLEHKFSNE